MEALNREQNSSLQQPTITRIIEELRARLSQSQELTQAFDDGEARWRDGFEQGLELAIETLENALRLE